MVDVPYVDTLPSLLPRLAPSNDTLCYDTRRVWATASSISLLIQINTRFFSSNNLLARFIHNRLPSSLLFMYHTFFCHLLVYHFANIHWNAASSSEKPCFYFAFSLSTSKKSREIGVWQKYSTLEKVKILIFHLLVSRVASYPMVGLLLEIYAYFSIYVYFSCTFQDSLLLKHSLLFWPTCQVIWKVEGITFSKYEK